MNIISNEKLIRRNGKIAQYTMFGALAILAGGMFLSFRNTDPRMFSISLVTLVVGFALSQIGIYFSNKWGRSPRPDEVLNRALKGLDGRYSLYHYVTPAAHVLLGPAGLWVLIPEHQRGTITYAKGRWRQKGGNLYMKIFAQESLGRPDLEVTSEVESLTRLLKKHLESDQIPPIEAALVFTNPKVKISIPEDVETPARAITLDDLKDLVRKTGRNYPLSMEKVQQIQEILEG